MGFSVLNTPTLCSEWINQSSILYSNNVISFRTSLSIRTEATVIILLQGRPRERQTHGRQPERNPLEKKLKLQLLPDHIYTGNTFYPYFWETKKQICRKLSFFMGSHERGERTRMCHNGKPDGGCCGGGKGCPVLAFSAHSNLLLGSETRHPRNSLTQSIQRRSPSQQLPLAGTYWNAAPEQLQPQSALTSITLPHPTRQLQWGQIPAPLCSCWGSEWDVPSHKQDWFVLYVKNLFTTVEEQKQGS